jgi:hypothetical protein
MRTLLCSLLTLSLAWTASAATTKNDDSCDIAVMPAATLLLPYFEVDLDDPASETTLVTITNVSHVDAIARVTLWTDRAYPVFTFNVYLTGYDVQELNLYDVLSRGLIAPDAGTGTAVNPGREYYSDANPALDLTKCPFLPGLLTEDTVRLMRKAFTEGGIDGGCAAIGGEHENAVGYATIDVVGNCSSNAPDDPAYWTSDLRYDNVLIGDYQQIDSTRSLEQGGPVVHIRAIPEGGTPQQHRASPVTHDAGFPRTFYARYQSPLSPKLDGRQPLPSQFAARWIAGTSFKIWREGRAGMSATCGDYAADVNLAVADVVTFDEQENASGLDGARAELPATSLQDIDSDLFPRLANGAESGWMYLNLDRSPRDAFGSQAWVITSMSAPGRLSTDVDAIALGNGCSPPAIAGAPVAPAPNDSQLQGVANTNNDDSCDVALLPAATLLLPYFAVDLDHPDGETTLFTITNVSPQDRIARVTLWTDYAFPVITFNVYLTGYDVQGVNLYDVIARGLVAPDEGTGTRVTRRGPLSERNRALDLGACGSLPGQVPAGYVERMKVAFTEGVVADLSDQPGCNNVGNVHESAVGYATIDVVRNCRANSPFTEEYWTEDLAWDNVLIGDFHLVDPAHHYAQGSPLVHVRAIPEGGTAAERLALPRKYDAGFPRTFYAVYQSPLAPKLDGRQPLPSVFAARWQDRGPAIHTDLKIWREAWHGRDVTCPTYDDNVTRYTEMVSFDEAENAVGDTGLQYGPGSSSVTLPATARIAFLDATVFPPLSNGAISGWVYMNLDNDDPQSGRVQPWASQNWVVSTIRTEGRDSVDLDAAVLGNGCSAQGRLSEVTTGTEIIGPRP